MDHLVRQTIANSRQVLSSASPVRFIFCHSIPQACIFSRGAAGRRIGWAGVLRGAASGTGGGDGAARGAAEGDAGVLAGDVRSFVGREGGIGAVAGDFGLDVSDRSASVGV
jgi:hypothetical protein